MAFGCIFFFKFNNVYHDSYIWQGPLDDAKYKFNFKNSLLLYRYKFARKGISNIHNNGKPYYKQQLQINKRRLNIGYNTT